MFNSIEKVENVIWKNGNLTLQTVVTTGQKNAQDGRRDALYYRTYNSQKYSDMNTLDTLSVNDSAFLVFSYKGYDENNKFQMLEVYMSYKQVQIVKDFFETVFEEINTSSSKIYTKTGVSEKFKDLMYESEPLINDNKILIFPDKLQTQEGIPYNGIVIVLENAEGENYSQEISMDSFWVLVNILSNYDLLTDSRSTMIIGMLYRLIEGNGNSSSTSSGIPKRAISNSSASPFKRRPTRIADIEEDEDSDDETEESDEKETSLPKRRTINKSTKKAPAKKTVTKKSSEPMKGQMNLQDMLDAADDEEFDFTMDDDEDDSAEF